MHFNDFRQHVAAAVDPTSQIPHECPGMEGAEPLGGGSRFVAPEGDLPLTSRDEYQGEIESPRPPSLDSQETSVRAEPNRILGDFDRFWHAKGDFKEESHDPLIDETSHAARFRHASWQHIRARVWQSLQRTGQSTARRCAFGACGSFSYLEQSDQNASEFRLRCNHCHDRLCTPCATARSARISSILLSLLPAGQNAVSFITLTLCGKNETLRELVDRLYKHFRALRQHPLWDESVTAGAAFLEIKWSDKAQRWHPHLHIVCLAKYIDQGELSDVWRGITKDSYIVDISRVRDLATTGRYVTKYASKPLNSSFSNTPALLDEALLTLKGRRMCLCFGDWYGTPLTDAENDELSVADATDWHFFCPMEQLIADATSGVADAIQTLKYAGLEGLWRLNNLSTPPPA